MVGRQIDSAKTAGMGWAGGPRMAWGAGPCGPPAQIATSPILQSRTDLNQDNVLNKTYSYSRFNDNMLAEVCSIFDR